MLQLELWNVIFTVVNVLILFILVRIFLFKPIKKILEKRQAEADEQYNEAVKKEAEAEALKEQYENAITESESEKKQMLLETRRNADEEYKRIIKSANDEARTIRENAVAEADSEKEEILETARKDMAEMVSQAVDKVILGDGQSDSAIYDKFLEKAGDEQ